VASSPASREAIVFDAAASTELLAKKTTSAESRRALAAPIDWRGCTWRRRDGDASTARLLPLVGAGIAFMDSVRQEGKVSGTKTKAA